MKTARTVSWLCLCLIALLLLAPTPVVAGDKLFFLSRQQDQLTWMDWDEWRAAGKPLKVLPKPRFVVQGPDPDIAFVLSRGPVKGNKATGPGGVSIVDTKEKKVVAKVELGWGLCDFHRSPDGRKLFILTGAVGLNREARNRGGMYVFSLGTRQVEGVLPLNYNPVATALSPDGKLLAVLSAGLPDPDPAKSSPPSLQFYDLASEALVAEEPVPVNPVGLTLTKDGAKLAVLTAGYPSALDPGYPQTESVAPQPATVSVWDVRSHKREWLQEVGGAPAAVMFLPDGSVACPVVGQNPTFVRAGAKGVQTCSIKEPVRVVPDSRGRVLYVVSGKAVEVLDTKTWSITMTIPHEGTEYLDVEALPDGRGLVYERGRARRATFYDPAANQTKALVLSTKPIPLLIAGRPPLQRQTIQVVGRKLYLLTYVDCSVAVVDLDTLTMIKEIPLKYKTSSGRPKSIMMEALYPDPRGGGLLACASESILLAIPINTQTDEAGTDEWTDTAARGSTSFFSNTVKFVYTGPLLETKHKVLYTLVSQELTIMELGAPRAGFVNLGGGEWDPQVSEKVSWSMQGPKSLWQLLKDALKD